MVCTLSIRRMHAQGEAESYSLRITGRTAVGPSGTGGEDTKDSLTSDEVHATLQSLGLGEGVWAAARAVMSDLEKKERFTVFAEEVQIPFESLERADFYLFD